MKKSKVIYGSIITIAVLAFLTVLVLIVGWQDQLTSTQITFNIFKYSAFNLLLFAIIPLELGTIVYLSAIVNQELILQAKYNLATALLNYLAMMIESISIALVFALGDFRWLNLYLVYLLFGFRLFTYPKDSITALIRLLTIVFFPAISVLVSHTTFNLLNLSFKTGYFIVASLIVTTLIVLVKYYLFQKNTIKETFVTKYLIVLSAIFFILVFLPMIIDYSQSYHLYVKNIFELLVFICFVAVQSFLTAKNVGMEA